MNGLFEILSVALTLVSLAVIAVMGISFTLAAISLAPWVPTKKKDLARVVQACQTKPGETFLEIGCGNGRVALAVHDAYDQARVIGVEKAWPLALICKARKYMGKKNRFEVLHKNILKTDISQADVLFTFGMPDRLAGEFGSYILQNGKKGARFVSYVFKMEGVEPAKIDKPTEKDLPIYTYII